jgi:thioredoxin 1
VPEVAQELSIRAMPTFLLFKGGKLVGETGEDGEHKPAAPIVGANPSAIEAAIKKWGGESAPATA